MNEINGKESDKDTNGYGQTSDNTQGLVVADKKNKMPSITMNQKKIALPLHMQRLVASLDMSVFMSYANSTLAQPLTSSESEGSDIDWDAGDRISNGIKSSKQDRLNDKMYVYNFADVGPDRKWLQNILLSDSESESDISDEDSYVKKMLRDRIKERKRREKYYKKPYNSQYGYLGAGLLSMNDPFPEHQQSIVGTRKRKRRHEKKDNCTIKNKNSDKSFKEPGEIDPADLIESSEGCLRLKHDSELSFKKSHSESGGMSSRGRKKRSGNLKIKPENMKVKRKKVWQIMAKKELGKIQRAKANNHKEILQGAKRLASMCMKVSRQKAMQSQKIMKETVWRAKRLTREMLGYWKRYDRVERETRRRMEKEAEEQRKMDVELIEVKRQQRKLNFLITQTELYAHFMSKKLGKGTEEEQLRILSQLDEEINPRLASYDDYNCDLMKQKAQKNAELAFNADTNRTQQFDVMGELDNSSTPKFGTDGIRELPQPDLFQGTLKTYQLKGMTWLANLYDQGISGILADEMGLGKTVQSIAFLCHIAERYGVWGPFLIISPASTLHNWQQEMQRFVPKFNVVPYWGSPNERKILRQFWEQKDLHTKDASFHVVITSYQLVVSDYKYFNRIKWQYMILDEAQAIKSSSSMRWKLLLGFNCRNRLLLSGTPIQNSMAELWALLHFIMPTLFDSHDEFNEWFSKDIESHAENKTGIDEKQISRLHMILKPFMLRRIKKDVENELSDKIEIMVYCPLTTRQKLLYIALKKKIRIEDLLHYTVGGGDGHVDRNFTSNLMNLVMQFRKVCNHPELFERRDAKSPFSMKCEEYTIARLIYDHGILNNCFPSKKHLLYNRFNIFKAEYIQRSLFPLNKNDSKVKYTSYIDLNMDSAFSFSRFIDLTPMEIEDVSIGGIIKFLKSYLKLRKDKKLLCSKKNWSFSFPISHLLLQPSIENPINHRYIDKNSALKALIFTSIVATKSSVYTFGNYQTVNMQETIEHRVNRSRIRPSVDMSPTLVEPLIKEEIDIESESQIEDVKSIVSPTRGRPPKNQDKGLQKSPTVLLPEFPHLERPPTFYECEPLDMPKFLYQIGQRVQATKRRQYCHHRGAEWAHIDHNQCYNEEGRQLVYGGLEKCKLSSGWSSIIIPDKQTLVSDAGKLAVLDSLLTRLKAQGHRVLIYSQMTKMIDLLEEYMWHRKHRYMRLDGSSKISARRDMVADFQTRADIFVFLLSTRAGGLGINLTAADTVIFYDSDWNPTVDQQAMDRAHRLGQTKQVTVYRLICKGTIEERILQRAREKSEIQRMVISGGNFKPDTLKPKEVVSLLLDDEEIELKFKQKTEEFPAKDIDRKRKIGLKNSFEPTKHIKCEGDISIDGDGGDNCSNQHTVVEENITYSHEPLVPGAKTILAHDDSSNETLIVDCDDGPNRSISPSTFTHYGVMQRRRHHPRGTKRGRPRGSRRGGGNGAVSGRSDVSSQSCGNLITPVNSIISETQMTTENCNFTAVVPQVKRGPGRPRLKPMLGPPNQGNRGSPRTRKPIGPLVVPLGQSHQSPAATPLNRSPAMSPAHDRGDSYT